MDWLFYELEELRSLPDGFILPKKKLINETEDQ